MSGFFLGFIGGIVAWFATTFVGQPLLAFIAARSEAARVLAQYEELDRHNPVRDEFPETIVIDRRKSLSAAGAQLVAIAHAYQFLMPVLRKFKLFPQRAGSALILLSQMRPSGSHNEDERDAIMKALRLGRRFGKDHRI